MLGDWQAGTFCCGKLEVVTTVFHCVCCGKLVVVTTVFDCVLWQVGGCDYSI